MAELANISEVRAACYAEQENDVQLEPIKAANEAYVLGATGYVIPNDDEPDPRLKLAVLNLCFCDFWPDKDEQGHIRASVTRLIKQVQAELLGEV